jgi:endoglucanase
MSLFWSQWMVQFYTAEAVRWLKEDWNCTIIRAALAVEHGGYLQDPQREMAKIRTVMDAAIENGLYVIIDWHDHVAHQYVEQAKQFFEEIARTCGHQPNIIYELWNEPLNRHDWSTVIKPYHEAVVPVIRAHDPHNLIVCGTQTWSQDVDKAAEDPLASDNVAYVLHFYAATHKQRLRDKANRALDSGIALMVTEWGTSEANGSGKLDEEETRAWLAFMDEHQLSWCNWSVADKDETSAALRPGASGTGGWRDEQISPSGLLVREALRAKNPRPGE